MEDDNYPVAHCVRVRFANLILAAFAIGSPVENYWTVGHNRSDRVLEDEPGSVNQ